MAVYDTLSNASLRDFVPSRDGPSRQRALSTASDISTSSYQSLIISSWILKSSQAPQSAAEPGYDTAQGSFTVTPPASELLYSYLHIVGGPSHRQSTKAKDKRTADASPHEPTDSGSASPLPSPTSLHGPSISRTSSPDTCSERTPAPSSVPRLDDSFAKLHPILEAVEGASQFSSQTVCVACGKHGRDFPRCPRCGDLWCSRQCRMQGGKRHVCRAATN
ncbi:hypothetical protein CONPUDRAFT_137097 [Coniophora puteana RWD-64-598 SS2]|uniref:HIT-type domain-containing protein n=1 Tax=Coniophora puteana (strain RWD-64-598) TaxID=741705 RepID=A0A5M3MQQ3_CONPW|nr:uncharacterized protein CONPUDRAFT_137097 [Coniophora puteana RWD-64-598 SS2]EIW80975.1 hypothetical protein CONPUDRAFT_137097 [Coniophora puteana RWD-64-598 SS2]